MFTNPATHDMTIREVIRKLEADGWVLAKSGKHKHYVHPTKKPLNGRPLLVSHGNNKELSPGTLSSILKNAGLK